MSWYWKFAIMLAAGAVFAPSVPFVALGLLFVGGGNGEEEEEDEEGQPAGFQPRRRLAPILTVDERTGIVCEPGSRLKARRGLGTGYDCIKMTPREALETCREGTPVCPEGQRYQGMFGRRWKCVPEKEARGRRLPCDPLPAPRREPPTPARAPERVATHPPIAIMPTEGTVQIPGPLPVTATPRVAPLVTQPPVKTAPVPYCAPGYYWSEFYGGCFDKNTDRRKTFGPMVTTPPTVTPPVATKPPVRPPRPTPPPPRKAAVSPVAPTAPQAPRPAPLPVVEITKVTPRKIAGTQLARRGVGAKPRPSSAEERDAPKLSPTFSSQPSFGGTESAGFEFLNAAAGGFWK